MASNHSKQTVQNLWNHCNGLREDDLSYGDRIEKFGWLLLIAVGA
ncbi:MAG: hypothetical protein AB7V46_09995 [Thermomicrobiales bacterium]